MYCFLTKPQQLLHPSLTHRAPPLACCRHPLRRRASPATNLRCFHSPTQCVLLSRTRPPHRPLASVCTSACECPLKWATRTASPSRHNLPSSILKIYHPLPKSCPTKEQLQTPDSMHDKRIAPHLLVTSVPTWSTSSSTQRQRLQSCRHYIKISILWRSNTISLVKTASIKVCQLCAAERIIIWQNFANTHRWRMILNLKSELCGICSCKTRFLQFARSE